MNTLQSLRETGYLVQLASAGQVRIRPAPPPEWMPRLRAEKAEIIRCLLREQSQPLKTVTQGAELVGLAIIPDDRQFIKLCLLGKTKEERTRLLNEYRRHWLAAEDAEPLLHCKENAGRNSANSWLRGAIN